MTKNVTWRYNLKKKLLFRSILKCNHCHKRKLFLRATDIYDKTYDWRFNIFYFCLKCDRKITKIAKRKVKNYEFGRRK